MIKKLSVIFSSSLILALIATSNLLPQKAIQNRDLILNPDVRVESYVKNNIRFDLKTNVPIALYSPNYQVRQASPQQMAEQFLSENSFLLKIQRNLSDLKYNTTTDIIQPSCIATVNSFTKSEDAIPITALPIIM